MQVAPAALEEIRERHTDETMALVHGVFDIIHPGHLNHIETAKRLGEVVVVAIASDENVAARKGPERPINAWQDRARVVDSLRVVDYVFELSGVGWPDELIRPHLATLQPDYYLLSSLKQRPYGDNFQLAHPNGRWTYITYDPGYRTKTHSTTNIIERARR